MAYYWFAQGAITDPWIHITSNYVYNSLETGGMIMKLMVNEHYLMVGRGRGANSPSPPPPCDRVPKKRSSHLEVIYTGSGHLYLDF